MFKQIVVGVDEHEGGRDAIALAKNLLARDGELTLSYVSGMKEGSLSPVAK
jgi:nucleotide-binding universal stress UspA family protein